jgi:hypothetical protein
MILKKPEQALAPQITGAKPKYCAAEINTWHPHSGQARIA